MSHKPESEGIKDNQFSSNELEQFEALWDTIYFFAQSAPCDIPEASVIENFKNIIFNIEQSYCNQIDWQLWTEFFRNRVLQSKTSDSFASSLNSSSLYNNDEDEEKKTLQFAEVFVATKGVFYQSKSIQNTKQLLLRRIICPVQFAVVDAMFDLYIQGFTSVCIDQIKLHNAVKSIGVTVVKVLKVLQELINKLHVVSAHGQNYTLII